MDPVTRRLWDENEIRKLIIAFSIGLDARDRNMIRAAFAEEVELSIPPLGGDAVALAGTLRADDYADGVVALLSEFDSTQHVSSNHLIDVDGDAATMICYTHATHHLSLDDGHPWLTLGARYDIVLWRFPDFGWRIVKFDWTQQWSEGNDGLWAVVTERLKSKADRTEH